MDKKLMKMRIVFMIIVFFFDLFFISMYLDHGETYYLIGVFGFSLFIITTSLKSIGAYRKYIREADDDLSQ